MKSKRAFLKRYLWHTNKFIFFLFLYILLIARPVYPQSEIEKATREIDRLRRKEEIEKKLERPAERAPEEKPAEAPPKKEEQRLSIKKINLVGCESFLPDDFYPIVKRYEGREVALSELDALTKEIEQEYLKRGIIAAAFVPPQEVQEQTVILQVVEARMGEVQIKEHRYFKKNRINYYWKVPSGEILRYDKIAKSVQLMNKNPDRQVKAALFAGKKPGTTDIMLTPTTRFPVHSTFTYDKEGVTSTGQSRDGVGIRHNNFLGIDDTFLTGYSWGKDFSGRYAYHSVPINSNGASLLYGYSRSRSAPKKEYARSLVRSWAEELTLSLHQDLYKKDKYLGEIYSGFEAKDKTIHTSTGVYNRDRLRVFNVGGNLSHRGVGNITSFSPEYSQGVNGFGSSSKNNPFASRNAKPTYSKLNVGLAHRRAIPFNLQTNLKFKSQLSSRKLAPQEEFSLGGMDSVRGYPAGDYLADYGLLGSAELLSPLFFIPQRLRLPYAEESVKDQTTGVIFLDYGWGKRRGPSSTDKASVNMLGVGAGLRASIYDQALLRFEWGFPIGDDSITEEGDSRFHVSIDFQDRLPEELARIKGMIEEENIKQWAWQLVNEELKRPDSPIRNELEHYRYLARTAREEKRLKDARKFYKKVAQIGKTLYNQAEEYVRACVAHEKELREKRKQALEYDKAGNLLEAKELWQSIIDTASPKPLIFEVR